MARVGVIAHAPGHVRGAKDGPQSNNGMHPTADTPLVKFRLGAARRVMPGVRTDWMRRAANAGGCIPALLVGLTSACTRPATRVISCSARVAGGRVMRGVRLLRSFKSLTETCGWQRRAAFFQLGAPVFGDGPRFGFFFTGRRGRRGLRVSWVAGGAWRLNRAPEQRHAPDRGHDGFQVPSRGCAAGDAGR
jgi:hypothetical protein